MSSSANFNLSIDIPSQNALPPQTPPKARNDLGSPKTPDDVDDIALRTPRPEFTGGGDPHYSPPRPLTRQFRRLPSEPTTPVHSAAKSVFASPNDDDDWKMGGTEEPFFPPSFPRNPSKAPPPVKRYKKVMPHSFRTLVEKINKDQALTKNGAKFTLTHFGNGQHGNVYTVTCHQQLIPGRPNNSIVIKVPSADTIDTNAEIGQWVLNTGRQHDQMQHGARGVPILNRETIEADGYLVCPRMARHFDVTIESDRNQLRDALKYIFAYNITADAHNGWPSKNLSSNIMVNSDNVLYIIDYMEATEDDLNPLIQKMLPTYVTNAPADLGLSVDFFDPRILDVSWDQNTDVGSLNNLKSFFAEIDDIMSRVPKGFNAHYLNLLQKARNLDKLPVFTLRGLVKMQQNLKELLESQTKFSNPGQGFDFVKARNGNQLLQANLFFNKEKPELLDQFLNSVSNGNEAIRAYLDPRPKPANIVVE